LRAALDIQGDGSVLDAYRAALALRRDTPALRFGSAQFFDLPEPILALRRQYNGISLTCVFNLSASPVHLHLRGQALLLGPHLARLTAGNLSLPAYGYAFLIEDGTLELTA
jgi:alpha-glucosidase